MKQNKAKLEALILYILSKYNNSKLTETKLQKLLYFSDFGHYQENGDSITGYKYRKNIFGPTIMDLPAILKELEDKGYIKTIIEPNYYGTPQKRFCITKIEDNLEKKFESSELLIIDRENQNYINLAPREISNISHADFPYKATKSLGDVIDYDLVRYREDPEDNLEIEDTDAKEYFTSSQFVNLIEKVNTRLNSQFQ